MYTSIFPLMWGGGEGGLIDGYFNKNLILKFIGYSELFIYMYMAYPGCPYTYRVYRLYDTLAAHPHVYKLPVLNCCVIIA